MGSIAACTGRYLTAIAVMVFAGLVGQDATAQAASCRADFIEIQVQDGPVGFQIEVVDTEAERAQGLMFRETLPKDHGMLFVYDRADQIAFWMKNTPLPLDIIFINRQGVVCSIADNTTPYSLDHIPSGCAAQTVLEVNAGEAAAQGIRLGAAVRHEAILDPVWSC